VTGPFCEMQHVPTHPLELKGGMNTELIREITDEWITADMEKLVSTVQQRLNHINTVQWSYLTDKFS
jgi:hypothetical protein